MSYKEFLPTAQQGISFSSADNSMSPTLGKYLERNAEAIPYWSPATRREENVEEYSSITGIVESSSASQLAPSANEFIPSNHGAGMFRMQSINGLNLQAAAWVPPTVNSAVSDQQLSEGLEAYGDSQGVDIEGDIEPMVEVSVWNMLNSFLVRVNPAWQCGIKGFDVPFSAII